MGKGGVFFMKKGGGMRKIEVLWKNGLEGGVCDQKLERYEENRGLRRVMVKNRGF